MSTHQALQHRRWLGPAMALSLGLTFLAVYLVSPIVATSDSKFAAHVAASFYQGDWGELTAFRELLKAEGELYGGDLPPQVFALDGRIFSQFPVGAPLVALPLLALGDLFDNDLIASVHRGIVPRFEHRAASAITALALALLWLAFYRRFQRLGPATLAILVLALGTSYWSVASRALWQHGPLLLCFGGMMLALADPRLRWPAVVTAGLLAGLAIGIRPTAVLVAGPVGLALLLSNRRAGLLFALATAPIMALSALHTYHFFGTVLPVYSQLPYSPWVLGGEPQRYLEGIAGPLISPSRGLFIYSPVLLFALWGFLRLRRSDVLTPLDIAYAVPFPLYLLLLASWYSWWGGGSFGPRLLSDILPFLGYFLVAFLVHPPQHRVWRPVSALVFALTFLFSAFVHGRGAFCQATHDWNGNPTVIGGVDTRERLWDWEDPQYLRGQLLCK